MKAITNALLDIDTRVTQTVQLPAGHEVLAVDATEDELTIVLHLAIDVGAPIEDASFMLLRPGDVIPEGAQHVGDFRLSEEPRRYLLFELPAV